jgi:hypothetical protein
VKCPRCLKPIGPFDSTCPACGALLILQKRPARPDEEQGWTLRLLASIMGRTGSGIMIAQNALVLIASAALSPQGIAFLSGTSRTADLTSVSIAVLVAGTLDLVGLGLLAVALIILGAGSVFLRRRDPFTEEEVMIPPTTAALPMAAGLFLILWLLVTSVWRVVYPTLLGSSAAQILADFASNGALMAPPVIGLMMGLWIVAAIALAVAALCLRLFVHRLPSKVVSPRPLKPSSWGDFAIFNLILTLGVATFPLGWIGYDSTGGPAQIAFLTFLATKLTVLPLLGLFAYWSLLRRFEAVGKLSLLVPMMKAYPPEPGAPETVDGQATLQAPTAVVPPTDDDMKGVGRVK